MLRSTIQDANLYFLNSAGVMFGPNAQLDVDGSFVVSTADYIKLGENGRFDATQLENTVLTSAPPVVFGFMGNNIGTLTIQGSMLKVEGNQSISLVGGEITANGGELSTSQGTINLISIDSPGEIIVDQGNSTLKLNTDEIDTFSDVALSNTSITSDNADAHGGDITVKANSLAMTENARIETETEDGQGGNILIEADELIKIHSSSSIRTKTSGEGKGGNVTITAASRTPVDSLRLVVIQGDDAEIETTTRLDQIFPLPLANRRSGLGVTLPSV